MQKPRWGEWFRREAPLVPELVLLRGVASRALSPNRGENPAVWTVGFVLRPTAYWTCRCYRDCRGCGGFHCAYGCGGTAQLRGLERWWWRGQRGLLGCRAGRW